MDDLVLGLGSEVAQKGEVVLHVLKHIHEQEEIEVRIFLLSEIRQLELQPFARQVVRPRKGLGEIISPRRMSTSPFVALPLRAFMPDELLRFDVAGTRCGDQASTFESGIHLESGIRVRPHRA